ncbi:MULTISPECIES: hypothetical protein [unclassified Chryseobacterium]|uniref:hypothetical protein n=1 Tax=unclassified Chryseobacterium TaxID=2593645 RepID=UPI000D70AD74|nr:MULTISPECIES: hypothetical protein [unclassified Chryseobacterium]
MTRCTDKLSVVFVVLKESNLTLFLSNLCTNTLTEYVKIPIFPSLAKIQRIFARLVLQFLE